jgi:hypothetical protein
VRQKKVIYAISVTKIEGFDRDGYVGDAVRYGGYDRSIINGILKSQNNYIAESS